MVFYAAQSADPKWVSEETSGFLGLGSYTVMFRLFKKFNFMFQLKEQGLIENMVFSIPRTLDKI
jgi:hypothetical protein